MLLALEIFLEEEDDVRTSFLGEKREKMKA